MEYCWQMQKLQNQTAAAGALEDTVMQADGDSGLVDRLLDPNANHQTSNTDPPTLQQHAEAWLVANLTGGCRTPVQGGPGCWVLSIVALQRFVCQ
jgi:hypothetical protein